jgi:hypothetical protein
MTREQEGLSLKQTSVKNHESLRACGRDDTFPLPHVRGDEFHHGSPGFRYLDRLPISLTASASDG